MNIAPFLPGVSLTRRDNSQVNIKRILFLSIILLLLAISVYALSVVLNQPTQDSLVNGIITLNATTDFTVTNVTWEWIQSGAVINTTINESSATNTSTKTFDTTVLSDGTYTLNATAQNSSTSVENSTSNITVDNTAPAVTLNAPIDNFNTSTTSINFNWTTVDVIDPSMSCNLTIDSVANVTGIASTNGTFTNQTVLNFADGSHQWNVTCMDNIGNTNTSTTRSFAIDTVAPIVNALSVNDTFVTNSSLFNISVNVTDTTTAVAVVNVSGDGGTTVVALALSAGLYSVETNGSSLGCTTNSVCTLTIQASDVVGNENGSVTTTVNIDEGAPAVTLNSPTDNQNLSTSSVNFNWTAIDIFSTTLSCDLTIDSAVNVSSILSTNNTATNQTVTSFAQGAHQWNVTCTDNATNTNTSTTQTFTIDTTAPAVLNTSVNDTLVTSSELINISANVTDSLTGVNTVNVTGDGGTTEVALALSAGLYSVETNGSSLGCTGEGTCTIVFNAVDNAGSLNNTVNLTITIDDNSPGVILNAPASNAFLSSASVTFNWTASDNVDTNLTCNLTIDAGINVSGVSSLNNTATTQAVTVAEGSHNWNVTCVDDIGKTNTSTTQTFTIDTGNPTVTALSLNVTSVTVGEVNNSILVNVTVNDTNAPVSTVNITGINTVSLSNVSSTVWQATTNATELGCTTPGTCTLTIAASDAAGNQNNTETTTLTITGGTTGNSSTIQTNKTNVSVTIGGNATINSSYTGVQNVSITTNGNSLLEFEYNFSESSLNFSSIDINESVVSGKNTIVISGLNMTNGQTKTAYMTKSDMNLNGLCIQDTANATAVNISEDCTGTNETEIECTTPGNTFGQYTCTDLGTTVKIEGLTHSGVSQKLIASAATTTSSGGGGGGGGGSFFVTRTINIASLPANVKKSVSLNVQDSTIKQIEFTPKISIKEVSITATDAKNHPQFIGTLIDAFQIDTTITPNNIDNIILSTKVLESALQGLTPDEISLYRYVGNKWVQLPTTYTKSFTTYTFKAKTPGFSFFAVGKKEGDESPPVVVEEPETQEEIVEPQQTSEPEPPRSPQLEASEEPVVEELQEEESRSSPMKAISIVLILLIIFGGAFFLYNQRNT